MLGSMPRLCLFVAALLSTLSACAQTGTAPILITPAEAPYPINARTAHIDGEVVVGFSIDASGKTVGIHAVSGPEVLSRALQDEIRRWRFATPLPNDSEKDFVADYTFNIIEPQEQLDDDVSEPTPGGHLSGGSVVLPPSIAAVSGVVRSVNNRQAIDATPSSPNATNVCRDDSNTKVPTGSDAADFIELTRIGFSDVGLAYRVRVYRNGKVEWRGIKGVLDTGERSGKLPQENVADLLDEAASADVWSTCPAKLTPFEQPLGASDPTTGNFVTVHIAGKEKTIDLANYASGSDEADKFVWYIDRLADTHHWRHGDAATEPLNNMDEDLELPKNGVTALMRAVSRFHPKTGNQSYEPLKHLLARGDAVDEADESGWTALMYAVSLNSNDEAAKLLLDAHADARHASLHGDTALMAAAVHGELNGMLLKAGADINAHNADGITTLMLLAQAGNIDALKQALAAGADPAAHDKAGRTAIEYLHACKTPIVPDVRHVGVAAHPPASGCPTAAGIAAGEALLKAKS